MQVTTHTVLATVLLAISHSAVAQTRCEDYYGLCDSPEICVNVADSFECKPPDPRCGPHADFVNETDTFRCDCTRGTRQCFYNIPPVPALPGNSSFGSATSTISPAEFPTYTRNQEWITAFGERIYTFNSSQMMRLGGLPTLKPLSFTFWLYIGSSTVPFDPANKIVGTTLLRLSPTVVGAPTTEISVVYDSKDRSSYLFKSLCMVTDRDNSVWNFYEHLCVDMYSSNGWVHVTITDDVILQ
eukprot:2987656-Rhodomonas_salina.1